MADVILDRPDTFVPALQESVETGVELASSDTVAVFIQEDFTGQIEGVGAEDIAPSITDTARVDVIEILFGSSDEISPILVDSGFAALQLPVEGSDFIVPVVTERTSIAGNGISELRVWNGTSWVTGVIRLHNGISWYRPVVRRWTGTVWEIIDA